MKPLRFRLRKVKEHRERVKQERRAALARVEAEITALLARGAAIERERERRIAEQNTARASRVVPSEEALFGAFLSHLDVEAARVVAASAACEARRDEARRALVEASIEVRAMEKLEERRRREHVAAEARLDVRDLDEVGRDTPRRISGRV